MAADSIKFCAEPSRFDNRTPRERHKRTACQIGVPLCFRKVGKEHLANTRAIGLQLHPDPREQRVRAASRLDPIRHHVVFESTKLHHASNTRRQFVEQRCCDVSDDLLFIQPVEQTKQPRARDMPAGPCWQKIAFSNQRGDLPVRGRYWCADCPSQFRHVALAVIGNNRIKHRERALERADLWRSLFHRTYLIL